MNFIYVGLGGIVGALLRYELTRLCNNYFKPSFPFITMLINITGAFLLALITVHYASQSPFALFFGTGICGGYTTFSTFSYESVMLVRERRLVLFAVYFCGTLVLGLCGAYLGLKI